MGAIFTQEVATARWPEFVAWLRGGEGQLVGTSLKATHDYLEAEYRQPCFLLIGNEQQGLPAGLRGRVRPAGQNPDGRAAPTASTRRWRRR